MTILREHEAHGEIATLDAAWNDARTFVLLPDKLGVSDEWLKSSVNQIPDELREGHFVMFTSGSTGVPKLVVGNRERTKRLTSVLHEQQQSDAVHETITLLPLSYTYSFVNQWVWSREHNRTLRLTSGFADPSSLQDALTELRSAMLCLVGAQVPLLTRYFAGTKFQGVIRLHFAGGRFPQEKLDVLRILFPNAQVFNNYGCAEAMPRLTLRHAEAASEAANVGRPLPGIEMRSDKDNALQFRSPYGAVGVVENGSFTAITREDWISTGDLGQQSADGSWRLLGRASEVFKRHGEKVSLESLTTTITAAWPGQCAFYRERDRLGEEGCVLTIAPGSTDEELKPILLALRKHHPRAQWPLRIESVEELPLLPSGKPNVLALPKLPERKVLWYQHI